ncbi:MAG: transglutaminase domain-containing protein [Eubacteriales bacterium]|nr:transglutaminase domain-containing protein [Eubacteriales bacterium]
MKKMKMRFGAAMLAVCLAGQPGELAFAGETAVLTEVSASAGGTAVWDETSDFDSAGETTALDGTAASSVAASSAKSTKKLRGLQKVNGTYCYYDKNGKKLKKQWKTIGGRKYYFNYKGNAVTNSVKIDGVRYIFSGKGCLVVPTKDRIVKIKGRIYCVSAGGAVIEGWHIVKNKLYYVEKTGLVKRNVTYEGITFSDSGAAVDNTASQLKRKTMEIVSSITNDQMTQSQKLYACWNYIVGRHYYAPKYPNLSQAGWQKATALNMLTTGSGNCYGFACAFAALAAEVGYRPYVVCGRVSGSTDGAADGLTRHAWVMIGGCYYDPEGQYDTWLPGIYGAGGYPVQHVVQSITDFLNG